MLNSKGIITIIAVLISIFMVAALSLAADTMVSGKVTADNQLVSDDGQIYEVADNETGNQLMEHMEKKVTVKGTVAEKDGQKTITVTSFKILK